MFKIGVALVFATIAALAIAFAGLMSDARISTILLRGLAGFLAAGVFSYITAVFLELKGWTGFDANLDLPMEEDNEEELTGDEEQEEMEEAAQAEEEEEFTPFSAENLKRVEPPPAQ